MGGTIYLSGPVTGFEDRNAEAFSEAQGALEQAGWRVINPIERVEQDADYPHAMRICITDLVSCDCIGYLDGWEKSRGCMIEMHIASICGIGIAPWRTWLGKGL